MPRSDAGTPATAPTAASTAASVTITLGGGVVVSARLGDSATARSLLAQLPLRLDFRDFGGQEKIATLPAPLDLDGAPDRAAAPRGTLGYYAPDQGLVLYYESVAAYPGIVPIGSIDDVGAVRAAPDAEGEVRAGT